METENYIKITLVPFN